LNRRKSEISAKKIKTFIEFDVLQFPLIKKTCQFYSPPSDLFTPERPRQGDIGLVPVRIKLRGQKNGKKEIAVAKFRTIFF